MLTQKKTWLSRIPGRWTTMSLALLWFLCYYDVAAATTTGTINSAENSRNHPSPPAPPTTTKHNPTTRSTSTSTSTTTTWEKVQYIVGLFRDILLGGSPSSSNSGAPTILEGTGDGEGSEQSIMNHPPPPHYHGLQMIGAGFSRTGTKSIEQALGHLGYRVYDFRSIRQHHHIDRWHTAVHSWKYLGELQPMDDLLTEIEDLGYHITQDMPLNILAPALLQLRPHAKVLYSHRDSFEEWYESYVALISVLIQLQYGRPSCYIFPDIGAWIAPIFAMVTPISLPSQEQLQTFFESSAWLPWYTVLNTDKMHLRSNQTFIDVWRTMYEDTPITLQRLLLQQHRQKGHLKEHVDVLTLTTEEEEATEINLSSRVSPDEQSQEASEAAAAAAEDTKLVSEEEQVFLSHQFLAYNVKQGWGPLLVFLQINEEHLVTPLPPFPHVNERWTWRLMGRIFNVWGATLPLWLFGILYVVHVLVVRNYIRRYRGKQTNSHPTSRIDKQTKDKKAL